MYISTKYLVIVLLASVLSAVAADDTPIPDSPENAPTERAEAVTAEDTPAPESPSVTRYSLWVTDEGSFLAGLRVPGTDTGNLFLVQPSLSYRGQRWTFASSLAGLARTNGDTHEQLLVRETYVSLSAADLDFTAGKRLVRWGTGYAFTATGVLDAPPVATDPTDRLNLWEGREMVKADWTHGPHAVSLAWASAGLGPHPAGMYDTTAFRYNVLVDGFDTSVIFAQDRGSSSLAGANFTRVFGESVEVHGELAWRQQAAVLLGGKYTAPSGWGVIAEFYTPPNTPYYRSVLGMPASVGRQHFGFVRLSKSRLRELPGWKQWDVAALVVANLDDHSHIGVFDVLRRFGDHLSAYVHSETPAGKQWRSEYGMIPYAALVAAGIRFQL